MTTEKKPARRGRPPKIQTLPPPAPWDAICRDAMAVLYAPV